MIGVTQWGGVSNANRFIIVGSGRSTPFPGRANPDPCDTGAHLCHEAGLRSNTAWNIEEEIVLHSVIPEAADKGAA